MNADSTRRTKLLQQIKRGRQTGATQWTRLFVMLVSAAEMFIVVLAVYRGKGNFSLLVSAIVIVFGLAMAAIGLGMLEMNERFDDLIELIGEEKTDQSRRET